MMHGDEIARSGGIEQLAQLARLLEQNRTLAAIYYRVQMGPFVIGEANQICT